MNVDALTAVLLIFGAACYLLLGGRMISARRDVGSAPIGVIFMLMAVWVGGGAIELLANSFSLFSIGRSGHFVATASLPVVVYACFREYIGESTSQRTFVLLSLLPFVSIALAATNQWHQLMWSSPFVDQSGAFLTRPHEWGPWFLYVHAPYSYLLTTLAIGSVLMHSSAVAPGHRRGLLLLAAACLVPLCATVAYDLGFGPNTMSFVPIVLLGMLPIYAWLIVGERIIEFTPLAYETVFQTMQDPVIVIDDQQRIIGMNNGAESLLEVSQHDALFAPLDAVMQEGTTGVFDAMQSGEPRRMLTSTGRHLHVQISNLGNRGASARGGQILMFRDVSDVEKAQMEVRNSEKLLRTLIDHSVNGIVRMRWVRDDERGVRDLRCIFANAAAGRFIDVDPDELNDQPGDDLVRLACAGMSGEEIFEAVRLFNKSVHAGESLDIEVRQRKTAGGRWLQLIVEPVGEDIALTLIDITDQKERENQMASIAWSDPLTSVLNRRGFERDAAQRLSDSEDDASGALLFIDLNEFKTINDECGHEVGDELLTVAAARLRQSLRSCDIIGRHGGDEFVALVPDVSAAIVEQLATRVSEALEQPYQIGETSLRCAASIGLALYPQNANTLTGLLREADQAMYRAKARTRGVDDVSGTDLLEKAG
jgi:diguanylate cyclase (GGDEF)-like protein